MKVWVNVCASNNAWSSGVTPEHLARLAQEAPVVEVFQLPEGEKIGVTGPFELREEGCELWSLCEFEQPARGHGESVLARHPDGRIELCMVAMTTQARGAIAEWMARRYPGRVGSL